MIFLLILIIIFYSKLKKNDRETGKNGTKDVKIMVLLKHRSNFWRTLKMPLI